MGHIFVSYSRHDQEIVDCLVNKIEEAGIRVWIDRDDIKAGRTWRAQIVEAIDTCDAFVLMLSSHSAASENVRKEIDLAQDSGRAVFIMRLDAVKLPAEMRYELVGLQHIDVQIRGADDATHELVTTLKEQFTGADPAVEHTVHQAELVIQGIDLRAFGVNKQQELLGFLSELTKTPASQLQITNLTEGSVHVFIDMPAAAAFRLKAQALNRDRRLRRFGIHSMRLAGDRKYVNIALGILTTTATIGFLKSIWLRLPSLFPSIVGITGGKVLLIALAIVITMAASAAMAEKVSTGPIPIPVLAPTATATLTPTQTETSSPTPSATAASTPTPISELIVFNDTLCWNGPGNGYAEISSIIAGTRVELVGRGSITGWLIVLNPRYQVPCWMRIRDLQVDPSFDFSYLPIFTPPANPSSRHEPGSGDSVPTPFRLPPCFYAGTCIFPIPATTDPPPN